MAGVTAGSYLEVITAPHHWGGSRSLEGQPECPGHTAGQRGKAFSRPGLSFPAFLVLEMLSTGTRLTWKQGRFKNKTRAGCASLLAHFAAFQLKGESQAWLFITNPDLACSSWGGGQWWCTDPKETHQKTHQAPPQPQPKTQRQGWGEWDGGVGLREELARRGRPRAVGRQVGKSAGWSSPPGADPCSRGIPGPRGPGGPG